MNKLVVATRGSRLALWQAHHIRDRLLAVHPEVEIEIRIVKTRGDVIVDVPLSQVGGKGLFVKEIEQTLLSGEADLAVHSMKDVPMQPASGLTLGIVPAREDPADMFLSVHHADFAALPAGAVVGTSSLRRQAQILAARPELRVEMLRGNVDTRLRKLAEGRYDAVVLAAAGLERLGLSAPHTVRLDPDVFVPAVGQGALGIEFREDRDELRRLFAFMEDPVTRVCVEAERGLLAGLEGSCRVPVAGHALMIDAGVLRLDGLVASPDGRRVVRRELTAPAGEAREAGLELARILLDAGGRAILDEVLSGAVESR